MRRYSLILLFLLMGLAGVVLAQSGGGESFESVRQIGAPRPQPITYNRPLDQFLWVTGGDLQLVDARTLDVQHTLYTNQTYKATAFNSTGTLLAVAIDRKVDLWDTATGSLLTTFEPDGILDIASPIQFADDDGLLLVNSVVPAPQEIRRSENDTTILPWLWDIPTALGQTDRSALPNGTTAYAFFDYRNGFILGYNDKVIAARPGRLEVLDVGSSETNVVLSEINSDRFERDPVDAWRGLLNDYLYTQPIGHDFTQIDTLDGSIVEPVGSINESRRNIYERMVLNANTLQIGERMATDENTLAELFLGRDYIANNNFTPTTLFIVDVLEPITPTAAPNSFMLYRLNEETARGEIIRVTPEVGKVTLSADRSKLALYTFDNQISVYDIRSGNLIRTMTPAFPDLDGRAVFDFDPTGTQILYDFQRFDINTGAVIFEELTYNPGFDDYYFDANSRRLTTFNYSGENTSSIRWWQWDIATGEVVRRETVNLRGDLRDTWYTGDRFLTQVQVERPDGVYIGLEIVEVGKDERPLLLFERVPEADFQRVIPSPDWNKALVIYFNNRTGVNDLALYTFDGGLQWYLPGQDLPPGNYGDYYWADNDTIAVPASGQSPSQSFIRYGIEYDANGLPACLVNAFPEAHTQWLTVWERRIEGLNANSLHALSQQVCEALEDDPTTTAEQVDEIITTPTPTRAPTQPARFRATQPVLAGVPECITLRFAADAEQYAEVWRSISAGLELDDLQELETIICEGITSTGDGGGSAFQPSDTVMLIDIHTQDRIYTRDMPRRASSPRPDYAIDVIRQEYEEFTEFNTTLNEPKVSPNGEFIAHRRGPYVEILRLNKPYSVMAAEATATVSVVLSQTPDALFVSLRPTITPTSEFVGDPRPTVTPTITPTSPPLADTLLPLENRDVVQDFCAPAATLYTLDNPPPGFAAAGTLYVQAKGASGVWSLDISTGELVRDLSIPACHNGGCNYSDDRQWILYEGERPVITSADGDVVREIVDGVQQEFPLAFVGWLPGTNVIEFGYEQWRDDPFNRNFVVRQYDPAADFYTQPQPQVTPTPQPRINELNSTEILTVQPIEGRYSLASTQFNIGRSAGYKYYIIDNLSGESTYFARQDDPFSSNFIEYGWETRGRYLYYRFQDSEFWYTFDTRTAQHYIYGEQLPDGTLSRDARYRAQWRRPGADETRALLDAGLPVPQLYIHDVDTGLIRRYCIPATENANIDAAIDWSPDSRYITFRWALPASYYDDSPTPIPGTTPTPVYGIPNSEPSYQSGIVRTFILDTETGHVTEISTDVQDVLLWVGGNNE